MTASKTYRVGYAAVVGGWRVTWRLVSARSMLNFVDGPIIPNGEAAELAAGYFKTGLEFAGYKTTPGLEVYPT